jgi:hypothetical protein
MKLGPNRERQVTELEEARLRRLPLLAGVPGAGEPGAADQGGHYHGPHDHEHEHGEHQ